MTNRPRYGAVLFDLLTALLDSWSVWNESAGSETAGRAWRAEYLRRTYGCGAYRPYETLVREAAQAVGLDVAHADRLDTSWRRLAPWPEAYPVVSGLRATHRLGVVTNCSEEKGRNAAARIGVAFDVVVTAERAGYYKPDPRPYRIALEALALPPERVLFVAGSGYDLFGTHAVGLDTYWHNRAGIPAPAGAPPPLVESATLHGLPALALSAM